MNDIELQVKKHLTQQAMERLARVQLAHPHIAHQVYALLAQTIQKNGTIIIDEHTLKKLLQKVKNHGNQQTFIKKDTSY
ncbi:MAG: DNA-binding protein [Candidatus Woesearchaeota archaeon]